MRRRTIELTISGLLAIAGCTSQTTINQNQKYIPFQFNGTNYFIEPSGWKEFGEVKNWFSKGAPTIEDKNREMKNYINSCDQNSDKILTTKEIIQGTKTYFDELGDLLLIDFN